MVMVLQHGFPHENGVLKKKKTNKAWTAGWLAYQIIAGNTGSADVVNGERAAWWRIIGKWRVAAVAMGV
jgi:hypothetical protein